jgi:hypothetical protein
VRVPETQLPETQLPEKWLMLKGKKEVSDAVVVISGVERLVALIHVALIHGVLIHGVLIHGVLIRKRRILAVVVSAVRGGSRIVVGANAPSRGQVIPALLQLRILHHIPRGLGMRTRDVMRRRFTTSHFWRSAATRILKI